MPSTKVPPLHSTSEQFRREVPCNQEQGLRCEGVFEKSYTHLAT